MSDEIFDYLVQVQRKTVTLAINTFIVRSERRLTEDEIVLAAEQMASGGERPEGEWADAGSYNKYEGSLLIGEESLA